MAVLLMMAMGRFMLPLAKREKQGSLQEERGDILGMLGVVLYVGGLAIYSSRTGPDDRLSPFINATGLWRLTYQFYQKQ